MTDRTFRDPSPSRNKPLAYRDQDAPPVPAVPNRYMSPPPVPAKSIRRPASVEPPERVLSPPPRPNGRGVSLDRGPGMMKSMQKRETAKPTTALKCVQELDRGQSRDAVNYSRPMSPTASPPSSPVTERRIASPLPQMVNPQRSNNAANVGKLRDGEAENIQYSLQETAQAPVKKKKKVAVSPNAAGSHLAAGASAGRATGTAVHSAPQRKSPSINSNLSPADKNTVQAPVAEPATSLPKKKKKKTVSSSPTHARELDAPYASDSDSAVSERSNISDRPRTYNTRAACLLLKQPSIVREDREGEEIAESSIPKTSNGQMAGGSSVTTGVAGVKPNILTNGKMQSSNVDQTPTTAQKAKATSLDIPRTISPANGNVSTGVGNGMIRQSLSPARAAHFSSKPIYETPEGVKHQPPARSVSPAKSALKHSPSRGASPVADIMADPSRRRGPASEASDTTSVFSDDGLNSIPKKKKSVRISFDNESTVVGRAATPPTDPDSPMVMSPQAKGGASRRWLPFSKDKKERASSPGKDEDSVIQPTPHLPSFGSVRGRNDIEQQTPNSNRQQTQESPKASDVGVSSDERLGSIISRVFAADEATPPQPIATQVSTTPLPPEVTSVEGSGYHSDTGESSYSEQGNDNETEDPSASVAATKNEVAEHEEDASIKPISKPIAELPEPVFPVPSIAVLPATPRPDQAPFDTRPEKTKPDEAPTVAIQPATPVAEEKQAPEDDYWVHLPGEFPVSTEPVDSEQPLATSVVEHRATEPTPAGVSIAEPEPSSGATPSPDHPLPIVGGVAERSRLETESDAAADESGDTNDSIYSDAAEDISDLEGDGFGSINAIVESPATSPQAISKHQNVPERPIKRGISDARDRPTPIARNDSEMSEPDPDAGWEKAQEYWSGLSQQRKQQMERAAVGEFAKEEPMDEAKPKPKKKKTAAKQPTQPAVVSAETNEPPLPPWPDRQYRKDIARPSAPKAPTVKKTTRASQKESPKDPPATMKKSLRDSQNIPSQEPTMRTSMRNSTPFKPANRMSSPPGTLPGPHGALQKKQRPVSTANAADHGKPQSKSVVNHDRAISLGGPSKAATAMAAGLAKTNASVMKPLARNNSDSSSSFKKARSKTSDGGRYTMKRSMRGSSADDRPQSMHDRSMSLTNRTTSPTGSSGRPLSVAGSVGPTMRTSMRASMDSGKRAKSPTRSFGFGKSKAKAAPSEPKSRFSSRFADSSDEEDDPVNRRSRFADSSDEDEPVDFTPVRGIPRRIDEGDSTDLEDSSDEKVTPKPALPQSQTLKPEGRALGAGSLRPVPEAAIASPASPLGTTQPTKEKEKKKRSFFGGLGSKKTPKSEPISLRTDGHLKQDVLPNNTPTKADKPLNSPAPTTPTSPNNISSSPQI